MRRRLPQPLRRAGQGAGRFLARDWPGLLGVLGGTLALLWPRLRKPETIWLDEVFSVLMANRSFGDIIGLTGLDVHPPLYYFLLKGWMKVFRLAGTEPGLVETRLFGVVALLVFLAACWFLLRRFLGRGPGSLATVVVAFSPIVGGYAAEVRQYALLLPMGCACWLILCGIAWRERLAVPPPSPASRWLAWGSYGVLASAMLWMQLASGIVLFWLGIFWMALLVMRGRRRGALMRWGAATQFLVVASILPWMPEAVRSLAFLEHATTWWMTEANLLNAWGTPFFWGVYGKVGAFDITLHWHVLLLSIGGFLLPLAFLPGALLPSRARLAASPLLLVGCSGVLVAAAIMLTMFFLAHFGIIKLFHAPRYPMMAMPILLMGVVGLSAWSLRRHGLSPAWAWLLFALMGYNFWGGHRYFIQHYEEGPAKITRTLTPELFPPPEVPVYIHPVAAHGLHRPSIPHPTVLPVSRIADHPADQPLLIVFMMSTWGNIEHPDAVSFRAALNRRMMAKRTEREFLDGGGEMVVMAYPHDEVLARFGTMPWHRALRPEADDHPAIAAPERQRPRDGWSTPEVDAEGAILRHALREEAVLRFDGILDPGPHRLRLVGHTPEQAGGRGDLALKLPGAGTEQRLSLEAGFFEAFVDFEVQERVADPAMTIRRRTNAPGLFTFYEAWIQPGRD